METKDFKFTLDDMDEERGTFTGFASVFDVVDSYNEVVLKGSFRKTLRENDGKFPLTWMHDIREPLGVIYPKEKNLGLHVKGHLNLDVQSAREKRSLVQQGAISGMSIGFRTMQDEWDNDIRRLKECKLHEIALITRNFQACPGADVDSMKSDEFKPFPNEHSARIKSPGLFDPDTFKRTTDGTIYGSKKVPATIAVIWGKLKDSADPDDKPIPQALRFPVKNWTAAEAKKWLKDNEISYMKFEPATKSLEGVLERILSIESANNLSPESIELIKSSIAHLETLREEGEPLVIGTLGPILEPSFEGIISELRKLNTSLGGKI